MSELMNQALKEGISFDDDQNEGQPEDAVIPGKESQTDANSDKSSESQASNSANGAANTGEAQKEENLPFHKHPKWERMQRENEDYRSRIQQMEDKYTKLLESALVRPQQNQDGNQTLAPEQKQSLLQLVKLIKSDPEAAKELGISSVSELQSQMQQLNEIRESESFKSELDGVIGTFSKQYGFKSEDFEDELKEFINNDPHFGNVEYSKGMVEKAAQVMLFGRIGELKEREINTRLLNEKKQKQANNSESSGKGSDIGGTKPDFRKQGGIMERIQQAGGLSV